VDRRRRADFITAVPKPKKRKAKSEQEALVERREYLRPGSSLSMAAESVALLAIENVTPGQGDGLQVASTSRRLFFRLG
jgi:hypothetical protein